MKLRSSRQKRISHGQADGKNKLNIVDGSADVSKGKSASGKVVVGFPEDWGRICITAAGAASAWRGRCQVSGR
ncbi:hypothetical protein ACJ73_04823 [Blastomyces percursus]|uniref:Uncharacterized protein n=1 Tax=Blastomyces percursus TaxID=1658174 RepID=A0A1J9QUB0_9EURO|nr:hypothetical protein ACJ73_04823 [Blastomyces percursus]